MTRKLNTYKAYNDTVDRRPAGNNGFAKKRVQWLIEHSTSHQLLYYVDSFVLRNPLLRKAAKRYQIFIKPNSMIEEFTLWSTIQTKSKCYVIKKY